MRNTTTCSYKYYSYTEDTYCISISIAIAYNSIALSIYDNVNLKENFRVECNSIKLSLRCRAPTYRYGVVI